jgi:translocation and assembly module TamA
MIRGLRPRLLGACVLALLLAVAGSGTRAADPLPYQTTLAPTGDAALDQALHDSSTLLALQSSAPVSPFALVARARDDTARLLTALHSFGYYAGSVTLTIDGHPLDDPELIDALDRAPATPPQQVTIQVTLGPLFHLGTVAVRGDLPAGFASDPPIHTGDPAQAAPVLAAGTQLLARLQNAGYALATIDPPIAILHPDTQTLDVTFVAHAGPRLDLGPITIAGLDRMNEAFVRNRLTVHQGDQFDPAKIEAARADLAALGVFAEVRAEPAATPDANGQLPLRFVVTERKLHAVDLGLSYATDLGVSPAVTWQHRNLFGNAEQLNLTASATDGGTAETKPGYKIGAQFIKPDFLTRDQSLQIEIDALRQDYQAYDKDGLMQSLAIARPLWPHWTVSLGASAEQEYITQESVGRGYNLLGLPLTLKYDSSNDLLNPTAGIRAAFSANPIHSFSAIDATFTILQVSASTYVDVSGDGRSVIALRGLLGEITGASQFDLPPDQRFYAGGSATVRGFRYQSLGPQFADGKPQGGTAIGTGTMELRQRLWGDWGMAAFVDVGQVTANGPPLGDIWRVGAGLGVRYFTSIGPIRIDVAVPVNRAPGGDSFELYIGLGQTF